MDARPKLSLAVITKNEEDCIRRCIESVPFAGEVIVVDSGSTDRTVQICRELGARVVVTQDYPGNGPQKNRALDLASGEWILSLDADEWLSPQLQAEIRSLLDAAVPQFAGSRMRRLSRVCGRFIHHSGWWPDWVVRLTRRGRGRFNEELAHDRMMLDGAMGSLRGVLMHEAFTSIEEVLEKMNRYSTAGSRMQRMRGRRGSLAKALVHGAWAFFRTYVLRAGFLDGREGFVVAVYVAENSYYKYVKLMYLGEGNDEAKELAR